MGDYAHSRLLLAVDKFNKKEYFECHEILEDIWFDTNNNSRNFYQGLLHIAVAFHHLTVKDNPKGAALQLGKALEKLTPYGNIYKGVNIEKLLKQISSVNKNLAKKKLPARLPKIMME